MSWTRIHELVNHTLFHLGTTPVSVATLVLIAAIFVGVAVLARWTRSMLRDRVLRRFHVHEDARDSVARIAGYVVILFGWLIGLTAVGIDLTSLTVLLGALGVGLGFGLQNVVSNFVSGLIILIERPIQVGNRVEVGGTAGRVVRIGARSTTIVTNDNIAIVVPNSKFIEENVVNWSLGGDRRVRFRLPVGVSYGSDPRQIEHLLLEVARADGNTLQNPPPSVIFRGFGDSALDFELCVWTDELYDRPSQFQSPLYFAIFDTFKRHGVEIPFPQRDLHVKGPVTIASSS
jgi:small-conductance mechanosensitive channel